MIFLQKIWLYIFHPLFILNFNEVKVGQSQIRNNIGEIKIVGINLSL
ncbi:hypothetical protein ACFP3I_06840 [Chryseobacterium arachidis]